MMDVMTATTMMPYTPSKTVIPLPRGVTAVKSPKPIVVTTAKAYHNESPKLPPKEPAPVGSTYISMRAEATIKVNKQRMISNANVLKTILINTLNLS